MSTLTLETKDQPDKTVHLGGLALTPAVNAAYWTWRVVLSETQAIVAFPKFGTVGVGFAVEEDWNTNLPYTCGAEEIFEHIKHNKGDDAISDSDVVEAIRMVQAAAREAMSA